MEPVTASLAQAEDGSWTVVVPGVGQVAVADPALADFEVRRLLQDHLGLDWAAVDDLEVRLTDASGVLLFAFDLLCTGHVEPDRAAALAAGPPVGCRFADFGGIPGLRCVRGGSSRLDAVGALVVQLREEYGIEADDLGIEKLWEWAGPREARERMVAQLLLMAARRARLVGLSTEDVLRFVGTVMG